MQKLGVKKTSIIIHKNWKGRLLAQENIISILSQEVNNKLIQANLASKFSIDIIISENMYQKLLFKFENGSISNKIGWFSRIILADSDILELLIKADIDEVGFWDVNTKHNQTIKTQDLLYLNRA